MCHYLLGEFDEAQISPTLIEGIKAFFHAEKIVPDGCQCIILVPEQLLPHVLKKLSPETMPAGLRKVIIPAALTADARSEIVCRSGASCINPDVDLDFERAVKPGILHCLATALR